MAEDREIDGRNHARTTFENMPSADDRGGERASARPDGRPHLRVPTLERIALVFLEPSWLGCGGLCCISISLCLAAAVPPVDGRTSAPSASMKTPELGGGLS